MYTGHWVYNIKFMENEATKCLKQMGYVNKNQDELELSREENGSYHIDTKIKEIAIELFKAHVYCRCVQHTVQQILNEEPKFEISVAREIVDSHISKYFFKDDNDKKKLCQRVKEEQQRQRNKQNQELRYQQQQKQHHQHQQQQYQQQHHQNHQPRHPLQPEQQEQQHQQHHHQNQQPQAQGHHQPQQQQDYQNPPHIDQDLNGMYMEENVDEDRTKNPKIQDNDVMSQECQNKEGDIREPPPQTPIPPQAPIPAPRPRK